jgi:hypothetical protein
VTISNFDKQLLIEQLRYIETTQKFICSDEEMQSDLSGHHDFDDHLWQRAQCLVDRYKLSPLVGHAARLSYYARTLALMVAALLGVLGILYAVSDSQTINIYWLLLVLLGFNFISMSLWLTGIALNVKGLTSGVLARLASWLPGQLSGKLVVHYKSKSRDGGMAADRAWLACNFSGVVGKWQFSKITHQLWLIYLLTGLAFLVLLLMVRQFDFNWGTTLLPDTAFIKLTEILSTPLEAIGVNTPTADQVYETQIGVVQILTAEHRYSWAQFLLGTLLCFGIAPRLLLLVWSTLMCRRARCRFSLDYYLPYYVRLRQQLMPLASHGQIIDADTSPPVVTDTPTLTPEPRSLPQETQWVAVELSTGLNWPPETVAADKNLGQIDGRVSLSRVLQHLQHQPASVIAVAVAAARPPDRGVQRIISSLMSASEQRWLVLLQSHQDERITENRLTAWYRLAKTCEVPANHVISMKDA